MGGRVIACAERLGRGADVTQFTLTRLDVPGAINHRWADWKLTVGPTTKYKAVISTYDDFCTVYVVCPGTPTEGLRVVESRSVEGFLAAQLLAVELIEKHALLV